MQTGATLCLRLVESAGALLVACASLLSLIWRELEQVVWLELRQLGIVMCAVEAAANQRSDLMAHCSAALHHTWQQAHMWLALYTAPGDLLGALSEELADALAPGALRRYRDCVDVLMEAWMQALAQVGEHLAATLRSGFRDHQCAEWLMNWRMYLINFRHMQVWASIHHVTCWPHLHQSAPVEDKYEQLLPSLLRQRMPAARQPSDSPPPPMVHHPAPAKRASASNAAGRPPSRSGVPQVAAVTQATTFGDGDGSSSNSALGAVASLLAEGAAMRHGVPLPTSAAGDGHRSMAPSASVKPAPSLQRMISLVRREAMEQPPAPGHIHTHSNTAASASTSVTLIPALASALRLHASAVSPRALLACLLNARAQQTIALVRPVLTRAAEARQLHVVDTGWTVDPAVAEINALLRRMCPQVMLQLHDALAEDGPSAEAALKGRSLTATAWQAGLLTERHIVVGMGRGEPGLGPSEAAARGPEAHVPAPVPQRPGLAAGHRLLPPLPPGVRAPAAMDVGPPPAHWPAATNTSTMAGSSSLPPRPASANPSGAGGVLPPAARPGGVRRSFSARSAAEMQHALRGLRGGGAVGGEVLTMLELLLLQPHASQPWRVQRLAMNPGQLSLQHHLALVAATAPKTLVAGETQATSGQAAPQDMQCTVAGALVYGSCRYLHQCSNLLQALYCANHISGLLQQPLEDAWAQASLAAVRDPASAPVAAVMQLLVGATCMCVAPPPCSIPSSQPAAAAQAAAASSTAAIRAVLRPGADGAALHLSLFAASEHLRALCLRACGAPVAWQLALPRCATSSVQVITPATMATSPTSEVHLSGSLYRHHLLSTALMACHGTANHFDHVANLAAHASDLRVLCEAHSWVVTLGSAAEALLAVLQLLCAHLWGLEAQQVAALAGGGHQLEARVQQVAGKGVQVQQEAVPGRDALDAVLGLGEGAGAMGPGSGDGGAAVGGALVKALRRISSSSDVAAGAGISGSSDSTSGGASTHPLSRLPWRRSLRRILPSAATSAAGQEGGGSSRRVSADGSGAPAAGRLQAGSPGAWTALPLAAAPCPTVGPLASFLTSGADRSGNASQQPLLQRSGSPSRNPLDSKATPAAAAVKVPVGFAEAALLQQVQGVCGALRSTAGRIAEQLSGELAKRGAEIYRQAGGADAFRPKALPAAATAGTSRLVSALLQPMLGVLRQLQPLTQAQLSMQGAAAAVAALQVQLSGLRAPLLRLRAGNTAAQVLLDVALLREALEEAVAMCEQAATGETAWPSTQEHTSGPAPTTSAVWPVPAASEQALLAQALCEMQQVVLPKVASVAAEWSPQQA